EDEYMKALELQRRAFEAQFGSIESLGYKDKSKIGEDEDEDEDEQSLIQSADEDDDVDDDDDDIEEEYDEEEEEFDSLSSHEGESRRKIPTKHKQMGPKVIKFSDTSSSYQPPTKKMRKLLDSGRIPTLQEQRAKEKQVLKQQQKQFSKIKDKNDQENLKNDLELQRLLSESHILSASNNNTFSGAELTLKTIDYENPIGKARVRTLNSRIKQASEINSTKQKNLEKMPMAMRKGLINKTQQRIAKYEQDAKNSGITLSKVSKGKFRDLNSGKGSTSITDRIGTSLGNSKKSKFRERGLNVSSAVGRSTRNGLILSKSDLEKLTNKPRGGGSNGKK
ncbi:hypothetical protein PACTADRAFT_19631, partial [Pachysolen tannophilus NRRL Y-2460]